jgi:hypothetical protein
MTKKDCLINIVMGLSIWVILVLLLLLLFGFFKICFGQYEIDDMFAGPPQYEWLTPDFTQARVATFVCDTGMIIIHCSGIWSSQYEYFCLSNGNIIYLDKIKLGFRFISWRRKEYYEQTKTE